MTLSLARRATAEFLGCAFLALVIIGSGLAAQQLSPGATGLELLENALATGAGLMAVIFMVIGVSGAHLNPVVSITDASLGRIGWREVGAYVPSQVLGCVVGAVVANVMFSHAAISISTKHRASGAHFLSEIIATAGLLVLIFALVRSERRGVIPFAVGAYIAGAYFFTSSTSFANPAVTVGRMFSNSFAGIAPSSAPFFIGAQLLAVPIALAVIHLLYPLGERVPEQEPA
ncbi:MAG TPA: MIP/aquaporin family protein [Acidimicrobiales bacterium]|jgi:arsenate reductase